MPTTKNRWSYSLRPRFFKGDPIPGFYRVEDVVEYNKRTYRVEQVREPIQGRAETRYLLRGIRTPYKEDRVEVKHCDMPPIDPAPRTD